MFRLLKNKISFSIFLLLFLSTAAYSQVEIVADGRLQTLLEQHAAYNQTAKTIRGYRIKVVTYTGNKAKNNSYAVRDKLQALFPQSRTYVTFDEPHFIVRYGDFKTRLEANRDFETIKQLYPTAIITRDLINLPPISEEDLKQPEYYEPEEDSISR
ncbi:MAG: SPOR domain-containing protein [Bacteroidales bacterium]|jgi:hypothetical protein|nr:SPOR domain-containing protein [Bacteroidales bacterium]